MVKYKDLNLSRVHKFTKVQYFNFHMKQLKKIWYPFSILLLYENKDLFQILWLIGLHSGGTIFRWYHPHGRKQRGTKESLAEGERGEWKSGLKLNIQKTKIMASGPISSVQFSHSVGSLWPHGWQHTMIPCTSPTPGACSNSSPLSQWCHPTILSSVVPFSSCLHPFPASGSFLMSQLFASVVKVLECQLQHQSLQ